MTGNGKQLKLMVLQGPLTNEQLRSSHPLSRLVVNRGKFLEIQATGELDSLARRTRIGSPTQYDFPYSKNKGNHHLEFCVKNAMDNAPRDAWLVLFSHHRSVGFQDLYIQIEYYSYTPEETIEYFI